MKLRTRLSLTVLAAAVPLFAAAEWLWSHLEERTAVASIAHYVRARMESEGRAECEASPETFGDRSERVRRARESRVAEDSANGVRWELFAYDEQFVSANPHAPTFPPDLRRDLERGRRESGSDRVRGDWRTTTVAARMDWSDGPCRYVLAECETDLPAGAWMEHVPYGALVIGGFAATVVFVTGPIGRRLRRLTASIQSSAQERYRGSIALAGSDEVAELASALDVARGEILAHIDEIRSRERALRDFVENTTHDVMLPLTVLQGKITDLRETIARREPVSRRTVQELLEELHYLVSLVQNLAAAAQMEAVQPEKRCHAFELNPLVERVVLRHANIAEEKGIELDFAVPEHAVLALGDVTMVEQALSNVVHNAVRYNRFGGHVAVLLDSVRERFIVRVFDDGPGVSDDELLRLSDRSYRGGAARERHPGGMGLGLSIAKAVTDWHGFVLALRRSAAGGLEVEIEGPIAGLAEPA